MSAEEQLGWLVGVKTVGLGRTLGVDLGIADVTEDLARRGTSREAAERKFDATGGSNIVYSCDIVKRGRGGAAWQSVLVARTTLLHR